MANHDNVHGNFFKEIVIEPELWQKIMEVAREKGAYFSSKQYFEKTEHTRIGLYNKVRETLKKENPPPTQEELAENKIISSAKSRALGRKLAYEEVKLTPKEKQLIKDIADGKVDMEAASRVIASKAFEKLLKFPDSASFTNFIQSEMLKLKKQELSDRNTWAMELVNRMFNGELPPRLCPNCGHEIIKLPKVLESEVLDNVESISAPGGD